VSGVQPRVSTPLDKRTFVLDSFMKTKGMVSLMRARHKMQDDKDIDKPVDRATGTQQSLQSLVESVKRKSAAIQQPGIGKRRKL
jgi:hypothetical protein